jgi:hypothetical protein
MGPPQFDYLPEWHAKLRKVLYCVYWLLMRDVAQKPPDGRRAPGPGVEEEPVGEFCRVQSLATPSREGSCGAESSSLLFTTVR